MNDKRETDKPDDVPAIRRILVAVDASAASLAALKTAVALAADLQAEVVGLFVEDINLLRLADLPFSQEVRLFASRPLQLSGQRMTDSLRRQAAAARRALEELAADASVTTTFRILRGQVPGTVVSASEDVDLVILGRVSRPVSRRQRLGSTARAALREAAQPVLVTTETTVPAPVVMVTFDDSAVSWRAMAQAVTLTAAGGDVVVLLVSDDAYEVQQWREETAVWLRNRRRRAVYRQLARTDLAHLDAEVEAVGCSLLVWGSERLGHATEKATDLLELLECSVLLVR